MLWKNEQYLRKRNNVNENKNEQTVELFVCIIKHDSYEFHHYSITSQWIWRKIKLRAPSTRYKVRIFRIWLQRHRESWKCRNNYFLNLSFCVLRKRIKRLKGRYETLIDWCFKSQICRSWKMLPSRSHVYVNFQ